MAIDFQPQKWKPKAKAITTLEQLPLEKELVIQVKCDGEFTVLYYMRGGRTFSINLYATMRGESFPWIREFREVMDTREGIDEAIFLVETYGVDGDRMLKLPDFEHELKTGDQGKVRLGIFDVVNVNGKTMNNSYAWRLQEAELWFKDARLIKVSPYIQPKTLQEVKDFWNHWVEDLGYEGLFARDDHQDLYKVKKVLTIDAVVIGLNKRERWKFGEVTSLRLALIDEDENFIELGDVASGIDDDLRKSLYKLYTTPPFVKREYDDWVQIDPFIVVEIEATETFNAEKPKYTLKNGILEKIAVKKAHSLRHPRLVRIRGDKKATVDDVGYARQLC